MVGLEVSENSYAVHLSLLNHCAEVRAESNGRPAVVGLCLLPLDVLFEVSPCGCATAAFQCSASYVAQIFKLSGPLELSYLAQTNSAFRTTLLSPACDRLWTTCCERHGIPPEPLPGSSRIAWIRVFSIKGVCIVRCMPYADPTGDTTYICSQLCRRPADSIDWFRPRLVCTLCPECWQRQYVLFIRTYRPLISVCG